MAGGPITSADIFRSIEPVFSEFIGLGYAEQKAVYSQIAKVDDTDKAVYDVTEYGGLSVLAEKEEGDALSEDRIFQGWSNRWLAKTFGSIVTFTMEALDDTNYDGIKRTSKYMGRAAKKTPEKQFALFLDRGFDSTFKVIGDRLPLFSTAHTNPRGGTFSNMGVSGAAAMELGEEGLEQASINLELMTGTDDELDPVMGKKLVVPAQLGPRAWKLKMTQQSVGSNVNDKSYVAGMYETVVNPYLGSATHWMLTTNVTEEGEGLFYKFKKRPTYGRDQASRTLDAMFYVWFRSFWGCLNARGVYGQNPS